MSNRMFISNYHIFSNSEVRTEKDKKTIQATGDFINGQPERYIDDESFWKDFKKDAFQFGGMDGMVVFICHSEFERTFLLIPTFDLEDFYFHSFWWNGEKSLEITCIHDIGELVKDRDFYVGFGSEGLGFSGEEDVYNEIMKQYEIERTTIQDLVDSNGWSLEQPLHYESVNE